MFSEKQRGFTLIEAIVAMTVFMLGVVGVIQLVSVSNQTSSRSQKTITANNYLQEGMDAVRSLRDATWANIATDGQYRLVPQTGGSPPWLLSAGGSETLGQFTRRVVVSSVSRQDTNGSGTLDAGDLIVTSGGSFTDPNTKKITIQVSWQTGSSTVTLPLNGYLTNWAS